MILPLGTYLIKARCPFLNTINTQIRLLNSTSTAVLLTGSSLFESSAAVVAFASLEGLFSLTTTSSVCIQYQCSNSQANNGLGSATSFGTEVFSVAEIIKIV
jgi:hypothetical protein